MAEMVYDDIPGRVNYFEVLADLMGKFGFEVGACRVDIGIVDIDDLLVEVGWV